MKAVFRDEIVSLHRKHIMNTKPVDLNEDLSQDKTYLEINSEKIIEDVESRVEKIFSRFEGMISLNDSNDSQISELTSSSTNYEHLYRTDPIWYPWL
jgi:hypothetical protein